MALWGFPALKIEVDDNGGVARDVSAYVTSINGWSKEQILEEITAAGDDDERWGVVGLEKVNQIVLTGPYDDTALGLYKTVADTFTLIRTFTITFDMPGAADVQNVECYILKTDVNPARGALHAVECTLQPTGAVT